MKELKREQYDIRYFDGKKADYSCNAGYSRYEDEGFDGQADFLINKYKLKGKVLDVGCAKGFLVGHLRAKGVEAYGIDWSEYALEFANEHCMLMDAADIPERYKGISEKYDYIISSRVLPCWSTKRLKAIIPIFNKHAKKQIHFIDLTPNKLYYQVHDLKWWVSLPWKRGTVLIGDSWNNSTKK